MLKVTNKSAFKAKTVFIAIFYIFASISTCFAQNTLNKYYNNHARGWWDVQHYDIKLTIDTANGFLKGEVIISAKTMTEIGDSLQLDLQHPMKITVVKAVKTNQLIPFKQQQNRYLLYTNFNKIVKDNIFKIQVSFEGIPTIALNPPWDGGLVLKQDAKQQKWIGMACQDIGASVWLPCKDIQSDEPDLGINLTLTVPKGLSAIGNGTLLQKTNNKSHTSWKWQVKNSINNYGISFYIGDYEHWVDTFQGANGLLPLDFYVLKGQKTKSQKQFAVVKTMLSCFEEKIGPYPFYNDGYKLVESPYLGMEHQSAVAYGNKYQMGYNGKDRSKTGIGLLFDFIIVHESGHEWFGNSITAASKTENWIHEGFTSYTETIFAECILDKEKAFIYQQGKRNTIKNDRPVMGSAADGESGSTDQYDKAGFLIHTIRVLLQNDAQFFDLIRAINQKYQHSIIKSADLEAFISAYCQMDFSYLFDQYLRQKEIPVLHFKQENNQYWYYWSNCNDNFVMPVDIFINNQKTRIYPSTKPQVAHWSSNNEITADPNYLIETIKH